MPKRTSLPSMLPPAWSALATWSTPSARERRIAGLLGAKHTSSSGNEDHGHRREERPALAAVLHQLAEREAERARDQQDREHLEEVRERRRVLERMGRVHVVEAAAVRAELLDRDLRGHRAERDLLRRHRRCRRRRSSARAAPPSPSPRRSAARPARRARARRRARAAAGCRASSARDRPRSCRRPTASLRVKPRISATSTAMPVAADTKFWTVSPSICVRWLIVVSPP